MCLINVNLTCVNAGTQCIETAEGNVKSVVCSLLDNGTIPNLVEDSIYFTKHGKLVQNEDQVSDGETLCLHLRLRGGKGGFGSMLRAMGSQIEKTTNKEACRDLNGRRMRDVNNEKKMIEWAKKKAEQEEDKDSKKIEKLERKLEIPKHYFNDPAYEKSLETTQDNVEDALKAGIAAHKRKSANQPKSEKDKVDPVTKKSKLWLGMDDVDSDADSSDDEDDILPMITKRTVPTASGGSSSKDDTQSDNIPTNEPTSQSKTDTPNVDSNEKRNNVNESPAVSSHTT
uniref:Protein SDE2 homolog n=1 Tax=Phallusia mammillata TaxID=59560 RepID=A0A6F9DSD4_9ASCI|nr:protein SDE2 homolog [Phallusia mammillata]